MAGIVLRDHDLTVLRIGLDRRGVEKGKGKTRHPESAVVAEAQFWTNDPVPGGRVPVSAIGLGDRVQGNERPAQFRLPVELLQGQVTDLLTSHRPIWLEIPQPCGHLRLVPWEPLLTEALGRPVLRLPYSSLRPQAARGSLEVAVCASSPRAKAGFDAADMLLRYVDAVGRAIRQKRRVHVFADADQYDRLAQEWRSQPEVVVHDPRTADRFDLPERTPEIGSGAKVRNPWLLWMLDELGGRAVDAVHFICHGYFAVDRGAIALASSPLVNTDATYSRFIGAAELGAFLIATGAWSIGLTGPEHNYAPLGLRDVADSLAQSRPMHVLAHEAGEDPELDEIEAAYGLMFATAPQPPPLLRASALWVHPNLVAKARREHPHQQQQQQQQQQYQQQQQQYQEKMAPGWLDTGGGTDLFGSATRQLLRGEVTPAWAAASARVIEQAQGDLLGLMGTPRSRILDTTYHGDVVAALQVAANLLERHIIASTPETGTREQGQETP